MPRLYLYIMLNDDLSRCAEAASLLWQKGWAERNGGNLLMRLDDDRLRFRPAISEPLPCGCKVPHLVGRYFYCKGSGHRMRDLAKAPLEHGSIIRICDDAEHFVILMEHPIRPTSELTAHLMIHNQMIKSRPEMRVSLHTHPLSLVALSHVDTLCEGDTLTRTLHSMIPEARLFCPQGIAVVPYLEPGGRRLATSSCSAIAAHDIILWRKHGVLSVGPDPIEAFDTIDIMEKAADIYIRLRCLQ